MKKILLVFCCWIMVNAQAQILINEYQCSNMNTAMDSNGEYQDWFELFNTTAAPIDLTGYYLSDKITNPTKWQIPSGITLPANGFVTVFANGKGVISGSEIHAGFKLTQTKPEVIVLTDAAGNPLDNVPLVPNQIDHSYGRSADGGANWVVFTNPTIGATNGTTGADMYTETPIFSQPAGNYNGSVSVSITSTDPGAAIRYTLDGSEPNTGSALYSGAITINSTSVLRAKSFSTTPNRLPSFIATNTYFIDEVHHVKVMSICGGDQGGNAVMDLLLDNVGWGAQDPVGHLELFDKDMNLLSEGTGDFNKHGNDSWAYDQRGFDYITRDQYGYNYAVQDTIFNGKDRSKFQRLIVKAAASDNYPFEAGGAHIRDAWCQSLSQTGGLKLDERSHESCVVYVDGQYWGVYEIREKVDDHDFTSYYYDQGRDDIDFIKTWGGTWADYGDMNAWNTDFNFITTNNMAIPANFEYADSVFNWKSLIDYTVLNSYMVCKDMLNYNTAWWHGKDPNGDKKKWRYILWDMDAIYGHYINFTNIPDESMQADPCNIETSSSIDDPEGHMEILNALMVNPEVEQWYISRYIDLANGLYSCDVLIGHLDSLVDIIDPEMQRHVNRWGGSYGGWQANVQAFRDSILVRCSSLNDGLVDCYEVEGPYRIAYNVAPINTGDIKINSTTPSAYPYAGDYFGGIDINLEANPASGHVFHYWEVINQSDSLTIDSLSNPAVFRVGQADSVIAHFIEMDTVQLSFVVSPVGAGDIEIDGAILPSYPHSDYYPITQQLTLEATPQAGYIFSHWSSDNGTTFSVSPTANPATITVGIADNITANFIVDE
ncbi:CotH kinase family protein, partial [Flavobacteriales bacterium]|nr:CotH kinase family protein [Flavobacteriales bacterium]